MNTVVLRKQLQNYIAVMPEHNLSALEPLLSMLSKPEVSYIIEPASPEECEMIDERVKEYYENPSSFVPL